MLFAFNLQTGKKIAFKVDQDYPDAKTYYGIFKITGGESNYFTFRIQ